MKNIINIPIRFFQSVYSFLGSLINGSLNHMKKPTASNFLNLPATLFCLFISAALTIVAFMVEPFGIDTFVGSSKTLLILGVGLSAFVGGAFALFLLPVLFKSFYNSQKWSISKALFSDVVAVFFSGLFFMIFGNQTGITQFNLPEALIVFTGISVLVFLFIEIFRENYLTSRNRAKAAILNHGLSQTALIENTNVLFPVVKFTGSNDVLSLLPNQLVKVHIGRFKSEFVYQNMFGTAVKTLEIPSTNVQNELKNYEQFVQLNKVVWVNQNAIINASGNARGVALSVGKVDRQIYVQKKLIRNLM